MKHHVLRRWLMSKIVIVQPGVCNLTNRPKERECKAKIVGTLRTVQVCELLHSGQCFVCSYHAFVLRSPTVTEFAAVSM
jgi:hypothetical protein